MCIRDSLWKNGVVRWDYIEDFHYKIEEYDEIDQDKLDMLLADDNVEIIGDLNFENKMEGISDPFAGQDPNATLVYTDVRIRRKNNKSRVKIENVPPEALETVSVTLNAR